MYLALLLLCNSENVTNFLYFLSTSAKSSHNTPYLTLANPPNIGSTAYVPAVEKGIVNNPQKFQFPITCIQSHCTYYAKSHSIRRYIQKRTWKQVYTSESEVYNYLQLRLYSLKFRMYIMANGMGKNINVILHFFKIEQHRCLIKSKQTNELC